MPVTARAPLVTEKRTFATATHRKLHKVHRRDAPLIGQNSLFFHLPLAEFCMMSYAVKDCNMRFT